jgi:hypothetical protein
VKGIQALERRHVPAAAALEERVFVSGWPIAPRSAMTVISSVQGTLLEEFSGLRGILHHILTGQRASIRPLDAAAHANVGVAIAEKRAASARPAVYRAGAAECQNRAREAP